LSVSTSVHNQPLTFAADTRRVKSFIPLAVVVVVGLATTGCGRIAARREAERIPKVTATIVATSSTSVPASLSASTTSPSPTAAPYPAGATTVSFEFDGRERTFTVFIPTSLATDRPAPLVFQLHGGKGTGVETDGLTKLNALAEKAGFITVAPDGVEKTGMTVGPMYVR
jgi:poly(3-hydroxybutyrate) depolymerase